MKSRLSLATAAFVLLFAMSSAQASDPGCQERFRTLLMGETTVYPYTAVSVIEFGPTKMKSLFSAEDAQNHLVQDETSKQWILTRGLKVWTTTNEGKTWKVLRTIKKGDQAAAKERLRRQADTAFNITCKKGIAYEGGTYDTIEGEWLSAGGGNAPAKSVYYLNEDGTWQIAIIESKVGGQKSIITQTRQDEIVSVPSVE